MSWLDLLGYMAFKFNQVCNRFSPNYFAPHYGPQWTSFSSLIDVSFPTIHQRWDRYLARDTGGGFWNFLKGVKNQVRSEPALCLLNFYICSVLMFCMQAKCLSFPNLRSVARPCFQNVCLEERGELQRGLRLFVASDIELRSSRPIAIAQAGEKERERERKVAWELEAGNAMHVPSPSPASDSDINVEFRLSRAKFMSTSIRPLHFRRFTTGAKLHQSVIKMINDQVWHSFLNEASNTHEWTPAWRQNDLLSHLRHQACKRNQSGSTLYSLINDWRGA